MLILRVFPINPQTAPLHISLMWQRWRGTITLGLLIYDFLCPSAHSSRTSCERTNAPVWQEGVGSMLEIQGSGKSQDYVRPVQQRPHRVEHDACMEDSERKKKPLEEKTIPETNSVNKPLSLSNLNFCPL